MEKLALKINEIFYSIQGESLFAGKPTVFVRTTACQMRCSYCDTEYAFHEGASRFIDDILTEIKKHPTKYVCVTGGEPLLQKAVIPFMERLLDEDYTVSIETGGGISVRDVPKSVVKIVDIKCPESGETKNMCWENLDLVDGKDQFKFVVSSKGDFDWAIDLCRKKRLTEKCPVLFSPVHEKVKPADLAQWVLESGEPVTLQLQLHKFIWGANTRGV